MIRQLLTVDVSLRATPEDAATHWWTNLGYTGTPIDNYSCLGRPVDYHKLKGIVHIDESSTHPQKSVSTVSMISNSQSCASNRNSVDNSYDSRLKNNNMRPRGILKRSTATSEDEAICMSAHGQDSFEYDTDVGTSNESVDCNIENELKSELVCCDKKCIYDSERRPKKSILKNSDQPTTFEEHMDTYYALTNCCSTSNVYDIEANVNQDYINDLSVNNDEINVMDYFSKNTPPYRYSNFLMPSAGNDNLDRQLQLAVSEVLTVNDTTSTGVAYDSGISEPNSLSQQDEWCEGRWDHERTDSQESNMSLVSSLWGGSSHSSAPPCPEGDSGGEESSTTSTVVFPLYDLTDLENAITVITDDDNNDTLQRLNTNIVVGVDEFGNEKSIDRQSPNRGVFTERTLCDHECTVSTSPSSHYLYHINTLLRENSQLKGILKKQSVFPHDSCNRVRGNRYSYGSTTSSDCSSPDSSRIKDNIYCSSPTSTPYYHDNEESHDYTSPLETLHRDSGKPNIMMNLLHQQM